MNKLLRQFMYNDLSNPPSFWRSEVSCWRCTGTGHKVRLSQFATEETCSFCRGRGKAALPLTELYAPGSKGYPPLVQMK